MAIDKTTDALKLMVGLDEEIEADHPGWMVTAGTASDEARARELLIALDRLLGKPIKTGPIADQAYDMILAALQSASPGAADAGGEIVESLEIMAELQDAGLTEVHRQVLRSAASMLSRASIAPASEDGWRPIETALDDGEPKLRPHIHYGPIAVKRPNPDARQLLPGCEWITVDYAACWPERAFLPFWMPLPAPPARTGKGDAK